MLNGQELRLWTRRNLLIAFQATVNVSNVSTLDKPKKLPTIVLGK
jgi:hypothetical protein